MSKLELKFKPSILSNNLAETAANEELLKADNHKSLTASYLKLMNQLEMDGIPKHKISSIGQKIIIEKKRNIRKQQGASLEEIKKINIGSWWYDVASEAGFTDPNFDRTLAPDAELKIVPLSEYEKENSEYMKIINDTIKLRKGIALQKLKTNHIMSLLKEEDDRVTITLHEWRAQ